MPVLAPFGGLSIQILANSPLYGNGQNNNLDRRIGYSDGLSGSAVREEAVASLDTTVRQLIFYAQTRP